MGYGAKGRPLATSHAKRQCSCEVDREAYYIHEQIHWFITLHEDQETQAMEELRRIYPTVPIGLPEGAKTEESTYSHLIVCFLEYKGLSELIGFEEAKWILGSKPFYRWIYATILRDYETISQTVTRHGLQL